MKISIWRQFSSNHSADFMVVGQFESVELAKLAADEITTLITDIAAWWSRFAQDDMHRMREAMHETGDLAPPEQKYLIQYQLQRWGKNGTIDWLQTHHATNTVFQLDDLVIVNQGGDAKVSSTWEGVHPFDKILTKLGADVTVECETYDTYFAMNLTCNAPSVDIAQQILGETKSTSRRGKSSVQLANLYPTRGKIWCENTTVLIKEYQFLMAFRDHNGIYHPFPYEFNRMMDYLRERGCTNIQYSFVEVPFEDEP